jgi:hypothetical protein
MSQAVIMSTPPPTQAEWTQAITGFIHFSMAEKVSCMGWMRRRTRTVLRATSPPAVWNWVNMGAKSTRSNPAFGQEERETQMEESV